MFPSVPSLEALTSQPFKRSQLGLFHGKTKQYGNNVPFSKHKTRRTWLPNVQRKRLFSETLDDYVRVKLTTRALRTIKKHGGVDNYVNKTRHELLGHEGMRIRLMVRDHANAALQQGAAAVEGSEDASVALPAEAAEKLKKEQELRTSQRENARRVTKGLSPTLDLARRNREQATHALGLSSLASARQTIQYLQAKKQELERLVRH